MWYDSFKSLLTKDVSVWLDESNIRRYYGLSTVRRYYGLSTVRRYYGLSTVNGTLL